MLRRCLAWSLFLTVLLLGQDTGYAEPAAQGASQTAPQTVMDFFLRLPDKYFDIPLAQRRTWIKQPGAIVDIKHDYLEMQGDGAQIHLNVCVFRHTGHASVVAVNNNGFDDPDNSSFLDFLVYRHGQWKTVNNQVLPLPVDPSLIYLLPRYGTTIHVRTRAGHPLYDLRWQGGRFKKIKVKRQK